MPRRAAPLALSLTLVLNLLLALTTLPAHAGPVTLYLKLTDIDGDVAARGFEKQIAIESYGFGVQSLTALASAGAASQTSLPTTTEFTLTKRLDKASVPLFKHCITNAIIDTAVLSLVKPTRDQMQVFFRITLKNVRIASIQQASGSDIPGERIVFTFSRMTLEDLLDPTANQTFTWDLTKTKMLESGIPAPSGVKPNPEVSPDPAAPGKQKKPRADAGAIDPGAAQKQAALAAQEDPSRAALEAVRARQQAETLKPQQR